MDELREENKELKHKLMTYTWNNQDLHAALKEALEENRQLKKENKGYKLIVVVWVVAVVIILFFGF